MCELPDVKFENFVAAKACLQRTLSPIGGVVERISIRQDQNGRAVWKATLNSSGNFPTPDPASFIAIRAVLNQHVPKRGVLRTINLEADMAPTQQWRWEVCYGIQRVTRIRQAIKSLKQVIETVTPCLKGTAETTQLARRVTSLEKLEKTKNDRRFFYNLRKNKKKNRVETSQTQPTTTPSETREQTVRAETPQTQLPATSSKTRKRAINLKRDLKSDSHALAKGKTFDFVKGETLPGTLQKQKQPVAIQPDYDEWEVKNILYSIKRLEYEFIFALHTIISCRCKDMYPSFSEQSRYAWAVLTVRSYSERIDAKNIHRVYKAVLDRAGVTDEFIATFAIPKLESKMTIAQRPTNAVHLMCH